MVFVPTFDDEWLGQLISLSMGDAYDKAAIPAVSRELSEESEVWRKSPSREVLFGAILNSLKSVARQKLEVKAIYLRLLLDLQVLTDGILMKCDESILRRFATDLREVDTECFTEELLVIYAQVRARCMDPIILKFILDALSGRSLISDISRLRLIGAVNSIGTAEASESLYEIARRGSPIEVRSLIGQDLLLLRDSRGTMFCKEGLTSGSTPAESLRFRIAWSVYHDHEQGTLVSDISADRIGKDQLWVIIRPHLRYNRFLTAESLQGAWWPKLLSVIGLGASKEEVMDPRDLQR